MAVAIVRTASPNGVAISGGVVTYTTVAIGTASADRLIYVLHGGEVSSGDPTSATIDSGGGAVAMNAGTLATFGAIRARVFKLAVPTGTTATIAITWTTAGPSAAQNHIAVYAVTGASETEASAGTNTSTDMDSTAPLTTGSVTIPTDGAFLAVAIGSTNANAKTWANATEDLDEAPATGGTYQYTTATRTTSGTVTITCTGTSNNEDGALAWVVFTAISIPNLVLQPLKPP